MSDGEKPTGVPLRALVESVVRSCMSAGMSHDQVSDVLADVLGDLAPDPEVRLIHLVPDDEHDRRLLGRVIIKFRAPKASIAVG